MTNAQLQKIHIRDTHPLIERPFYGTMDPSCTRSSSISPPTSVVAPVAVKALLPVTNNSSSGQRQNQPPQNLSPQVAAAVEQHQRIHQIYQLALAERIRIATAAAASWPRPPEMHPGPIPLPPLQGPMPLPPPHPAYSHLYPYRFMVDPRALYRVPEEPKPQHSYIGLIAMAILSVPERKLVLSEIYNYILEHFAYFRSRGPGWRNSIRHNLSLNDCFIKAGRSANGKGHYWAIHPANVDDFSRGDFRRRRAQRKVRRHMGLTVDDDSSPEPPPPSPPPIIPSSLPQSLPQVLPSLPPSESFPSQLAMAPSKKRQFDVASLLAPDDHCRDTPDRPLDPLSRTGSYPQQIKRFLWSAEDTQVPHHHQQQVSLQLLKSKRLIVGEEQEPEEDQIFKTNSMKEERPSTPPVDDSGAHEDPQDSSDVNANHEEVIQPSQDGWLSWPWRPQLPTSPAH